MGFWTSLLVSAAFIALAYLAAAVCVYCSMFDQAMLPTALGAAAFALGAFLGFVWRRG